MLSLSTAYNIRKHGSWKELIEDTRKLGFYAVELNVDIPASWLPDIERSASQGEIKISSLHNYCPRIENLPPGRTVYSGYFLTADDEEERKLAVTNTCRTIELAGRFGAQAVVIHAGEVPTEPKGSAFHQYAGMGGTQGMLFAQYREELLADRKKKAPAYLERLVRSFDECLPTAQKNHVTLCLENRYHIHEIPFIEETLWLFDRFGAGAPLAYWHDTGHAEVAVRLGWAGKHTDFLDALSHRMFGMHLHDIRGLSDHFAPGTKDFDFTILKPYLKPDTLCVVEAHSKSDPQEVKNSIDHLKHTCLLD